MDLKKRGQIQVSFGMIFSIILMVAFIFTAFVVIRIIMDIIGGVGIGSFINDLQSEVDRVWNIHGGVENSVLELRLDSKVEYVCFFNESEGPGGKWVMQGNEIMRGSRVASHNLYFLPSELVAQKSVEIEKVDMSAFSYNPHCIENIDGRVRFVMNKGIGESLVSIS